MQQRWPSLMVILWHHQQRLQTKRQLQCQQHKKRRRPDQVPFLCLSEIPIICLVQCWGSTSPCLAWYSTLKVLMHGKYELENAAESL